MDKKGAVGATSIITAVIGGVILLYMASYLWPVLSNALGNMSGASGLPLASLFGVSGVVGILFAVAVFYGAYKLLWKK